MSKIDDAKLPKHLDTKTFRDTVAGVSDELFESMLADCVAIAKHPTSEGRKPTESAGSDDKDYLAALSR